MVEGTRDNGSIAPLLEHVGPYNEFPEEYQLQSAIEALKSVKVLVVGAGGLGCEILKNLALTGFKNIQVIDMDTIDMSNLNRQFLFRPDDVGKSKAEVATRFILERIGDPTLNIVPYYGKIQDKDMEYYKQFNIVVCGLDSVMARRWLNATLVAIAQKLGQVIPLIDGGTEGFRGQSRVILPGFTSCYECTLDMVPQKVTYPVCTIANTPRVPEHCIEWASVLQWPKHFSAHEKFDGDNPDHVDWLYATALSRAKEFGIPGVTRSLTLGVVKNIIPAIASTNAIIAASCTNEAFKIATDANPFLNNYMMYSGDDSIFTYTYAHTKNVNCPVCGDNFKEVKCQRWWTLEKFIDVLINLQSIQLQNPSLSTTNGVQLYFRAPPELEQLTRENLSIKLIDQINPATEQIIVTDPNLPISLNVKVVFEGPDKEPQDINYLLRQ
ncbi:uncharacterized protein KQ657_002655 [Scheffersomyces spartinae]|uniref:NEDD8-activating enzyme E1 catalytic subunit n=1 Tax=Scheffersomyces spartinae TaxID=45513 RepID=A0A9P7V664_9ASCO|nr:uncharacterized protein KQ657_002655 [Scheffersomyces spartinae]KAG7191866.1 hypothetical protein KQ657_002655 [Scheffersomyces spartinae]